DLNIHPRCITDQSQSGKVDAARTLTEIESIDVENSRPFTLSADLIVLSGRDSFYSTEASSGSELLVIDVVNDL
ncbi:hypothetical protein, partial [Cerasicoccus maritimus]|uniref:hypothetical protein n=1 Tax=Cerasicoccus maritimus TaxID=490089 RepID=UPI0028525E56